MSNSYIYLDYAATTPIDSQVADVMSQFLTMEGNFGNSASRSHYFGWQAEEAVNKAREQVASLVKCDPRAIIWTSGATEADNLALKGAAHFYKSRGKHIISSQIEHKAVIDTLHQLEREGFEVTYIKPDVNGIIHVKDVVTTIREDTFLASFMHVNNEMGTITDINAIGSELKKHNIIFHVDAAQSAGKIAIDLSNSPVDLMSFSAHKIYGPKGIGALYVRRKPRIRLEAQIHGGGHEYGMRSGTLATHQIAGMGAAFALAAERMEQDMVAISKRKEQLIAGLIGLEQVYLNGDETQRVPNIVNLSFNYVEGESLIMAINELAVSSGSACTSASLEASYVLMALGVSSELAHSSIRFSIGRFTTQEDIAKTIEVVKNAVARLRELSPLWDMYKSGVKMDEVQWLAH